MIFIDGAQIFQGGPVIVLDILIDHLQTINYDFVVLRHKDYIVKNEKNCKEVISEGFFNRTKEFKKILDNYEIKKIICFCSFPPPFKTNKVVYTYFHNAHLLKKSNISDFSYFGRLTLKLKRIYLSIKIKNSNFFIVQTRVIKNLLKESYNIKNQPILIFPFFDEKRIEKIREMNLPKKYNFCYISAAYPHKNHNNLLDAWLLLNQDGYNPSLVLTVEKKYEHLYQKIIELNYKGLNIVNLEKTNIETALKYTAESNFCIFPSLSESYGLGLIEAQKLGLKIISSNLPYVKENVLPSLTFDPTSSLDIAIKVKEALNSKTLNNSFPVTENKIFELVNFICNES